MHTTHSVTERYCATVLTNVHAIRYTGLVSIRLARYWRIAGAGWQVTLNECSEDNGSHE